ncbi:MAG: ribosome small subunit-dependent GTPase A [Planctomycetes bacterium]|nr:ribosome small subunit-dependent GTPase A [Planctomycetota bacterium]
MAAFRAQVVQRSSRELLVRSADGEEWVCELRGVLRLREDGAVAVGDWVEAEEDAPGRGRVREVLPRKNSLSRLRAAGAGRELILAANIDQVVALFAARRPRLKFGALDRLLIAAEAHSIPARILVNKSDLGIDPEIEERLALYPALGYPVHYLSIATAVGVQEVEAELRDRASVVAGPSGGGKSSLLNALLPGLDLRVGEVSEHNEKGRHTTTAMNWYALPAGGALIDTPGFREYQLWGIAPGELAELFPEIRLHLGNCRFGDCRHANEPACGVRAAVESGSVAPVRYESYLQILESLGSP